MAFAADEVASMAERRQRIPGPGPPGLKKVDSRAAILRSPVAR
jgi:citrate synthase